MPVLSQFDDDMDFLAGVERKLLQISGSVALDKFDGCPMVEIA